jgi:uncharacterized protein YdaU (DUF1376 family)
VRIAGKNPAFQFYPKDWTADTGKLTPASRGIWIDLICDMWAQDPKGQTSGTIAELASTARCSEQQILDAIAQFERLHTCDVSRDCHGIVTLLSRRMIRDEKARKEDLKRQREHRLNRNSHAIVTPLSRDSHTLSSSPTPTPCPTDNPPKPPDGGLERAQWLFDLIRHKAPSLTAAGVFQAIRDCETAATAEQMLDVARRLMDVTGSFSDPVAKIARVYGDIVHPPDWAKKRAADDDGDTPKEAVFDPAKLT